MALITTHPGGLFYGWYVQTYGYAPPSQVNDQAARYLAWRQGVPRALAATIPYGSIGNPDLFIAGAALVAPVTVTTPASPAPITAPAATLVEAGVEPVAAAPAPLPAVEATAASIGLQFDQEELDNINTVLSIGYKLHASDLAIRAACCACSGENHWSNIGCNKSGHCGLWQIGADWQRKRPYSDAAYWTTWAYQQGFYGGYGGLIHDAAANPGASPGWLANRCQGAYADLNVGAAYYNNYLTEADRIIAVYGPRAKVGAGPAPARLGGGNVPATPSQPAPQAGGVFDLFNQINWAGDFINLWKYVMGGSNEAAHMAGVYNENVIDRTDYVNWPH